jgi:hypothetical protein
VAEYGRAQEMSEEAACGVGGSVQASAHEPRLTEPSRHLTWLTTSHRATLSPFPSANAISIVSAVIRILRKATPRLHRCYLRCVFTKPSVDALAFLRWQKGSENLLSDTFSLI